MEYKQITLNEAMKEIEVTGKPKRTENKVECPYILERIADCKSFNEFLEWCPFCEIYAMRNTMGFYPLECIPCNNYFMVQHGSDKMPENESLIFIPDGNNEYAANLVYTDDLWNTWVSTVKVKLDHICDECLVEPSKTKNQIRGFSISKWKPLNKLLCFPSSWQNTDNLLSMLLTRKPWAYKFVTENDVSLYNYLMAPQLEQLYKAGFAFAPVFFNTSISFCKSDVDCFNRIC